MQLTPVFRIPEFHRQRRLMGYSSQGHKDSDKTEATQHTHAIYNIIKLNSYSHSNKNKMLLDFPGGPVVKNVPANAGDMGVIPALGRSHMLWGL